MRKRRQQRLIFIVVLLAGVGIAATLAFFAIGENMLYFFTPTQVTAGEVPTERQIRVGGLVVDGSVVRETGSLAIAFELTDTNKAIAVNYTGILPDLFREGQGIIAIGKLGAGGVFQADEVLAKHDENYMPPEVAEALKAASEKGLVLESPHGNTQ